MTTKPPKGIVSPWAQPVTEQRPAVPPEPWKTEKDDAVVEDRDIVRFPGQLRTITVRPLHGKGDPNREGLIALGRGLLDLLAKVPEARSAFARQNIGFSKPIPAHISLDLGGVSFYAVITTAQPETAKRMVIDRVAFALTEARSRSEKAKEILDSHRIEVTNT